jgi:hypothetical protein
MHIQITDLDRLGLLERLADAFIRLHALGIVAGDFSARDLLFRLGRQPSVFFLDADAMSLRGESVLAQVETPDWSAPANEPQATTATDCYKFGLFAIRLFAQEQSTIDSSAIAEVDQTLGRLAKASQNLDPAARPTPADWLSALQAALEKTRPAPLSASALIKVRQPQIRPTVSMTLKQPADAWPAEDAPGSGTGNHPLSPWLWIGAVIVALLALGVLLFW